MRWLLLSLFFFSNIGIGQASTRADSMLMVIESAPNNTKLEAWENWFLNPTKENILELYEFENKALVDASEILGRDSAIVWHFERCHSLVFRLRAFLYTDLSIQLLDDMKITADSLSELDGRPHRTLVAWYYYMGNFYRMQLDKKRTIDFLEKALELNQVVEDIQLEYRINKVFGLHHSYYEEYDKAEQYFSILDSLDHLSTFPTTERLEASFSRAFLNIKQGNYQLAKDFLEPGVDSIHLFSSNYRIYILVQYGGILLKLGELNKSVRHFEKIRNTIEENNEPSHLADFSEEYANALIAIGRLDDGIKWLKTESDYREAISTTRNKDVVQKWQTKYQTIEKEAEIQMLEREKVISQTRFTILSMFALLGIGILSFFLYRNKNRQKQLALELEKDRQVAENRDRLFSSITHDIRTPLALMLAPLERAESNIDNEAVRADINLARRNGKRLMELFNQILDWNKAEAKAMVLNPQIGQLDLTFSSLCERFQQEAIEKGVKFTHEVNMPKGQFLLDYDKMDKIVSNLIGNAIKFCEVGQGVELNADFEKRGNDYSLLLKVSDQGTGIDEEEQNNIFNRYVQGTQGKLKGGTGIGLALVKELVEMMKGDIELESKLGEGTIFKVNLPIKISNDLPIIPLQTEEYLIASEQKDDGGKPLILIVEDEPELLEFLRSVLTNEYEVEIANSTSVGLNLAISRIPEVVISDWTLPDNNGGWLCRQIANNELTAHIPVMILTAHDNDSNQKLAFDAGAVAWMNKPFQLEMLRKQLSTILMQQKRAQNLWAKNMSPEGSSDEEEQPIETIDPFIQKVNQVIEENYSDETYSVAKMAEMLFLSRVQLFRKIKSITGSTPSKMINEFRLQTARQLLQKTSSSISEVAYQVGFSDPSYFGKAYKQYFKVSPSQDLAAKNK